MDLKITQLQQGFKKIPQKKLCALVVIFAVIYCAYLTARLVWLVWPTPSVKPLDIQPVGAVKSTQKTININNLVAKNLFGDAQKVIAEPEQKEVISDAPETNLSINLTGVVAANENDKAGLAIIESQGKQETYGIDDAIRGTRAKLAQVLPDRAILDVNGRFETLMLDGMTFSKKVSMPVPASKKNASSTPRQARSGSRLSKQKQTINATVKPELKQALSNTRKELLTNPGKLFDYIRVTSEFKEGQVIGYRLKPGKNPALFSQLGLKHNDLAVAISGYQLNDMKQAMSALQVLRTSTDATITIDRNGELIDVQFSL